MKTDPGLLFRGVCLIVLPMIPLPRLRHERKAMPTLKKYPWLLTALLAVGAVVLIAALSL